MGEFKLYRYSTGSSDFDSFLNGGYESDILTTIYGPGGSGKTNLCLLAMIAAAKEGKKVIFIDTESNFSPERFKQIMPDYENILDSIVFIRPTSFDEQTGILSKIKEMIDDKTGLVIIDSVGSLYRLEISKKENITLVNKSFTSQLSELVDISRRKKVGILLTNQVYSSFDEKDSVQLVGGDIMKFASKTLIELKKGRNNVRIAVVKKHRSLPENIEFPFRIIESGIEPVEI